MQSAARVAWVLFVLLAIVVGFNIWSADNGVSNVLLKWVKGIRHGDKYAHFMLYGGLAYLLHIALQGRWWRVWRISLPVAALVVLGFGLGEEISQLFTPRRQFDWIDLACNLGGVIFFMLLAEGTLWLLRRKAAGPSR